MGTCSPQEGRRALEQKDSTAHRKAQSQVELWVFKKQQASPEAGRKCPGRSCGWAKLLHSLLQAVGGARIIMAESGVHWWLNGGIFKHRGARTERPVVRIFVKVQASDDDRPELEGQIGLFQHVDLSDRMSERAKVSNWIVMLLT